MLTLEKVNQRLYNVTFNRHIGIIYMESDGYFVFQPDESNHGFWSENTLKSILDKLTELNKDWDQHLMDNLL